MKRTYIVEFTKTVIDDGITRPVLPWDGMGVPVRYIAAPDGVGGYAKNWVLAVVGGMKHADIINKPGVFMLPDMGSSNNLGAMAPITKAAMTNKLKQLGIDVNQFDNNTDMATVHTKIGKMLKPDFDPFNFDIIDSA